MNRTPWLKIVLLILLTFGVYWPVRHYGLIDFDDITYLFDNPYIKAGLSPAGLRDAFTHIRFANYAPLVSISYYLDQDFFHLMPGPMHVENVLLHLITGLLLWRLIFLCTGQLQRGFAVAVLFLCHPMHVESVAWISERKDVLSTPLLIGAMMAYVQYCRREKKTFYVLMLLLFALSLLTKSMGVTLPGVLLLMDFWPLRRWPLRSWTYLVMEKIPLIVLSGIFAVISCVAQQGGGAVSSLVQLDIPTRIENALVCYVIYIEKLLVPIKLSVFYPHPMSRPISASLAAGGLLLVMTIGFYRLRHRKPYLIFGWLWFLGTLLPVIGLVQLGAQSMADRYSYFPSIGLSIAVVWWICDLLRNRAFLGSVLAVAVAAYSIAARQQVNYWKDAQTLFTHTLAVTQDSFLPHDQLGNFYLGKHELHRAAEEYQRALDDGQDPHAFHGLGNCYLGIDYGQSVFYYQHAVDLLPRSVNYRTDLAMALRLHGDLPEAQRQAQIAVNMKPGYAPASAELATILAQLHRK